MSAAEWMLQIQALDPDASLKFSGFTNLWYVSAHIEIGDGSILTGVTEHCKTPEEATEAYFARISDLSLDEYLATQYRGHRREWRWNGAAFVECTRPEAMVK